MTFDGQSCEFPRHAEIRLGGAFVLSIVLTMLVANTVLAQTATAISGVVVDESGGAIVNATVTLESEDGRSLATTTTDTRGAFALSSPTPGGYQIRVEKAQFSAARTTVAAGTTAAANLRIVLTVAGIREAVDVVRPAPATAYSTETAITATRSDTPIMQTPLSVQVVPNQVLKDQQAVRLPDVTRNVSNVQTNFGYGALYEAFALRGFETNVTLRNGARVAGGIGRSSVELANVDDVEVLKGPAAMLYGRLEPGGMINVVTKKPLAAPSYSIQQQFGSYDLFRTTADATGPLNSSGTVLYRVIGSYFSADQFIVDAPHGQTQFFMPSLTWRPTSRLEMNVNFEYRNVDPLIANGIPAIGRLPADIPITTYLGGDVGDHANVNRKVADFNWSYAVTARWKIRSAVAVAYDNIDFSQFFGGSLDETPGPTFGDFTNVPWFDHRRSKGGNFFLDLNGHARTARIEHTLLLGTDYYLLDFSDQGFVNGWTPVDTMNIFNPVFRRSTAFGAQAQLDATPSDWTSVGTMGWNGVYAQDQMKLSSSLHLLLGGRYDWARATAGSITLEYADPGSTLNDVARTTSHEHKFSPQAGLLYQPQSWLSLYGNYVQSLGTWGTSNVIAVDVDGQPLPAQRSHSYEGGVKAEAFGGHLRSTMAIFDITKTNVATRDLSSPIPSALRAVGEAHSSGVEFDISGALSDRLNVIGSYAFTDATFSKDNTGLQGNRIANVPKHSGSVWAKSEIIPHRFSIGGGLFLRGEREGDNENTFELPGYVTADAYAAYAVKVGRSTVTPQVNISNLFDKRYFINTNVYDAYPRLGIMPGQPRTIMASIRWDY